MAVLKSYRFGVATFLFFLVTVIWSFIGTLDYVTVTQGVVTPSNKIKKIQHLEGGIIRSILVSEGQRVEEGTPLIELEATKSEAELNELETRLTALQIDLIRLEAEQKADKQMDAGEGKEVGRRRLVFPEKIRDQYPSKVEKAVSLFHIRNTALKNRILAQKNVVQKKKTRYGRKKTENN